MESRIIRLIISVILIGSMLITNPTNIFAADIFEDFEGWGFIDADPALSGGAYTYNNWKFIAKLDGVAANDGAIETWTGPAALSITTGYGDVDELHILNSNGDEFNFGGFNFTGSSVRSMFVTGWRDGIQVTEKQFINYTDATADEYFDMRSKDSEFKNVDEIRICGADLGGGNLDIISGYLESLTYDVTPVDEVPPIILGLTMTSDNANVTTVAKVGDQITLSITANENIQSPTVTIAGNTATVSDAGDSDAKTWKATYIMQESDTEGTIPFTLDFMDIANNAAMQVTAVTSGSPVIFDMTPPAAPTAVTVTPVGGTVIANSLNQSNTNMTATATITADDATGGKAELYLDAILIASDSSIVSGDTQVTFDLGTSTNAELQVAVALGGTISVKLYDVAGNSSTSSVGNPTLNVDYIFDLPAPPTATVHPITGTLQIGETLTGHYTYSDVNGDLEGASTYKWYSSDNMAGLNKTVIAGATTKTYVLTSTDIGKYISFEVTPVAATGIAQGIAVESARTGPVVLAEAVPTATVKAITGILQVGETLTGNYIYSDVNGDLEGASTYKWYRADNSAGFNKTEIAGANAKTYVLTSSDEGKYIGFEVTPVALTGIEQGTAVLSTWAGIIVPAEAPPTVTVQAITGTLQVGETLTGNYTYSDVNGDLEGTSTYKWYRADNVAGLNKTAIEGATSFTYVLVSADLGKYISFEVTPVAATGIAQGTAALSSWTGAIVAAEVAPTAIVQLITGTLQVGATLTGHYTYSDVNGDLEGTSTYKWYRSDDTAGLNKTVIAGATTKTYVLTSGDIGKYISFEVTPVAVTGTLQGIAVESGITGPVVLAEAVPKATVQPITGTLQVGRMLTGHYTYSDVNGDSEGTSIFKWYRADNSSGLNKTEIAGANAKTYVLTSSDEGKYIGFEVTPVALTGITQGTAVLSEWAGAIVPAEAAPTATVQAITGTLQVGETLTGNYTYSDVNGDLEGTSTYKWYRADNVAGLNKTAIEGATSFTYVLVSADLGKYISFEVTPVAATGIAQGTAALSSWTGAIVAAEVAPTAIVQPITGTLQVGESLTGNYTYSDVNGDLEGASTYKWYRADNMAGLNKTVIAGATTKTYVLTSGDIGKYISFEVTPVAVTGTLQGIAVESGITGPVVLAEAVPKATVQPITGTLQVGRMLTGHYTYSDVNGDSEGTSIFKWYRADNSSGLNKTEIAGANTKTYVLTSLDEGKYISFEVTPVAATGITQGIAVESGRIGPVAVVLAEAAPTATVQPITGILKVGETLTGHYTYSDVNGDLEGNSIYKWYRADDMEGRNKTVIVGARTTTYVLTSADEGKYICFEVTPVAATGIAQGIAIESVRTGVVGKKAGQSGGGGGSSYSPNPVITPTIDILINNDKVNYATSEIKMENGRKKTTIQLDDEKLTAKLNTENVGSTIIIPVYNNSDIVIGQLNGQTVKNMQDKDATLEIKTENVTYTIPAAAINIGSISERIGSQVQLKDIKVNISISNSSKETITKVETSAKMNNFQLVVHPTDFEITCTNGSKTLEVSRFNHYVERTVLLPKGVEQNQITTGVVLNKDGTFTHVPTVVKFVDGRYYAKINSLTNSTYTVIWNPVTFKDVEKHWAKDYVNDVGSRLIDDGVGNGNFAPNRDITRAEFASMVVKALGLKGTNFPEKFGDVNKGDSYYYSIYTAYEYGILTGYSNGNFGPQDLITREQAMTMLAKAMEIVDLNVTVSDADVSNQLKLFKDSDSISLYARQTATICVKNDIFAGDNTGKLTPKDNLTRAESATIIIKLLKKAELI
ncbi:S-layer homology domain-containing protein [Cellulosilyticum lentocellum]|uniref:S-layer domain-containing protein n=1 Tax=Cellulosilyticum lentocellum (strain ATCC 49066 / DSM 5427 / NCIMB 11756 / RHM5) TaxID=642492 RepID=F2JN50_CELLD|nr:S-layer homology domain-containing protein [Cellulosilyticum lentocellum]ADZ82392.1 S-layer domain-containing protein [Cellulosilyticum lentocellum DSM 5427]